MTFRRAVASALTALVPNVRQTDRSEITVRPLGGGEGRALLSHSAEVITSGMSSLPRTYEFTELILMLRRVYDKDIPYFLFSLVNRSK